MSAPGSCALLCRLIRQLHEETQVSLSKRMGVPRTYISKVERRDYLHGASIKFVMKFCLAYELDFRRFLWIAQKMDGHWRK